MFLILYVSINLIGGERGLVSYFEKKNTENKLSKQILSLNSELNEFEKKNKLLSTNIDLDYIDKLYREKLMQGTKNEIIIKLK